MGMVILLYYSNTFLFTSYPCGRNWDNCGNDHFLLSKGKSKKSGHSDMGLFHTSSATAPWFLCVLPISGYCRNQRAVCKHVCLLKSN